MGERAIDGELDNVTELGPSLKLSVLIPVYNERHLVEASVRRVLAVKDKLIRELQVVIVDDCSTDGSWNVLKSLEREDSRITLVRHHANQGKGAAIRTALVRATGDVCVIHDADLEYHPSDIPSLLAPFIEEGADAVFGSRYLAGRYRRALMYKHSLMNRGLTALSNWLTDLDLTDLETCYKAVRTPILKSVPLRSNDFRFEVEVVSKLAKRQARVFEVPIRYTPRSYREGKKIRAKDGLLAVMAMGKFALVDDIYKRDEYGSAMVEDLDRARRVNEWIADVIRPFLGDKVLELNAGVGAKTGLFIPRHLYYATDTNPDHLYFMKAYSRGKPYLRVAELDPSKPEDFGRLRQKFDTVLSISVLESVPDPESTTKAIFDILEPGGRLIILVPQGPGLFGSLDEALHHRERYTRDGLTNAVTSVGFEVEDIFDFNRFTVPAWWMNGRLLKKRRFSRVQLKIMDTLVPAARRVEGSLPWRGQSLVAVVRKPVEED